MYDKIHYKLKKKKKRKEIQCTSLVLLVEGPAAHLRLLDLGSKIASVLAERTLISLLTPQMFIYG